MRDRPLQLGLTNRAVEDIQDRALCWHIEQQEPLRQGSQTPAVQTSTLYGDALGGRLRALCSLLERGVSLQRCELADAHRLVHPTCRGPSALQFTPSTKYAGADH